MFRSLSESPILEAGGLRTQQNKEERIQAVALHRQNNKFLLGGAEVEQKKEDRKGEKHRNDGKVKMKGCSILKRN